MSHYRSIWCVLLMLAVPAIAEDYPALHPGVIASDAGGAPGYQHGLQQSHFAVGPQPHATIESGWSKQVSPAGAFAVSLHNGVAMALPNSHAEQKTVYGMDPAEHDRQVLKYFIAAGLPKDQVSGVHTMTRLSASGRKGDLRSSPPKVDGYISVIERKVDNCPVPDSVAWAQMNNAGVVVSEGVYWPAIPANVLRDGRRMREALAADSSRKKFLAHVPSSLPQGQIVIRHSSAAMQQGPFEALASYDVQEKVASRSPASTASKVAGPESSSVMRHFDVNGAEQRLPQERRNSEKDYPMQKKTPSTSASAQN